MPAGILDPLNSTVYITPASTAPLNNVATRSPMVLNTSTFRSALEVLTEKVMLVFELNGFGYASTAIASSETRLGAIAPSLSVLENPIRNLHSSSPSLNALTALLMSLNVGLPALGTYAPQRASLASCNRSAMVLFAPR